MKRYFLFPFVAFTLLQLAGTAATPPQKKKTTRASKKLPYKAKVPGVDPTVGDNVDGDDLVVRRAAVAALGTFAGSVVAVDENWLCGFGHDPDIPFRESFMMPRVSLRWAPSCQRANISL